MPALPKLPRVQPWLTTAKGLVGCWPLFEGAGGTLHDVSGYGGDFATVGAPPWIDQAGIDQAGGAAALNLDGATQYAQLAAAGPLNFAQTQPFSVICNALFIATNNGESLVGCLDPGNGYRGWELFKADSASGNWIQTFVVSTYGTSAISQQWALIPAVGVWYQLAMTYSGNSLAAGVAAYANGLPLARGTTVENDLADSPVSTVPLLIGRRNNGTEGHAGLIGETRVYNRALAASEIWDIYAGNG